MNSSKRWAAFRTPQYHDILWPMSRRPFTIPASADNIQNLDVATFYSFLTTDLYAFVV
jgi:hypothetical protein